MSVLYSTYIIIFDCICIIMYIITYVINVNNDYNLQVAVSVSKIITVLRVNFKHNEWFEYLQFIAISSDQVTMHNICILCIIFKFTIVKNIYNKNCLNDYNSTNWCTPTFSSRLLSCFLSNAILSCCATISCHYHVSTLMVLTKSLCILKRWAVASGRGLMLTDWQPCCEFTVQLFSQWLYSRSGGL